MAQRFAGVAHVKVDGIYYPLRGNFTVSPTLFERTMIAGQDRIHGYQELPRVPFIEGDISCTEEVSLNTLMNQRDSTVIAELANGKMYTLYQATTKGGFEENTRDGQVRVRWEGIDCLEQNISGVG